MKILNRMFHGVSRQRILLVGLLFVILVGLLDYLTGYRLGFSLFYILPIYIVTWLGGFATGLIIVLAATISWFVADYLPRGDYVNVFIPAWNILVRLSVFSVISLLTWAVKLNQEKQKALTHYIIHDLRTPVTVIISGLSFLREAELTGKPREYVDMISIAARRLNTLISSILDLERLKKGCMPITKSTFDLRQLIDAALEEVSVWAEHNVVSLECKFNINMPTIKTDRELLLRVLVNLLSNAIKVSPKQTTVKVLVTQIHCGDLIFRVVDQGRGISKATQKTLFNEFVQAQNNKVAGAVGSGLGLAFCKQAVEALGGKIWVESEEGKGAVFAFVLPGK